MDPPLWDLYETLTDAGRLVCVQPRYERARWFLDGVEIPAGTDYLAVFRRAAGEG